MTKTRELLLLFIAALAPFYLGANAIDGDEFGKTGAAAILAPIVLLIYRRIGGVGELVEASLTLPDDVKVHGSSYWRGYSDGRQMVENRKEAE